MTAGAVQQVEQALAAVLAGVDALGPEEVEVGDALGRVAYQAVPATTDLPRFDNAAMDGFAVRAADTAGASEGHPVRLSLVGRAFAGTDDALPRIEPGTAAIITTGAPLPPGADAIVRVERTTVHEEVVLIHVQVSGGRDVRRHGEDLHAGDVIVAGGTSLGPGQLAAVAGAGHRTVVVHRRPTVAVLLTGDEVVAAGDPLGEAQIPDAVGAALSALLRDAGAGAVTLHGPVGDDRDALLERLAKLAMDVDLVVTIGGVSRGERDLVPGAVAELGTVSESGVALRPGGPFRHGQIEGTPVACLPGNPGAALVAATAFVRPVVLALLGADPTAGAPLMAELTQRVPGSPTVWRWLRAVVSEGSAGRRVHPVGAQGAAMLHSLAAANAWLLLPPSEQASEAGTTVMVLPTWGDVGRTAWSPR